MKTMQHIYIYEIYQKNCVCTCDRCIDGFYDSISDGCIIYLVLHCICDRCTNGFYDGIFDGCI